MGDLLSPFETALLTSLVKVAPKIGSWIGGLIAGEDVDPATTRRVSGVLARVGASARAATEIEEDADERARDEAALQETP